MALAPCGLMDKACALSLPAGSPKNGRGRRGETVAALDGTVAGKTAE